MRLICPNCDAQYEIPADVMPIEGRDVQCSNCGYTWFQNHPDAPENTETDYAQEDEDLVVAPAPVPEAPPMPYVEEYAEETDESATTAASPDAKPTDDVETQQLEDEGPARRELDPAVADVLRAEAELEEQARRNEVSALESQPELGLQEQSSDAVRRAEEARGRMARMRGETPTPAAAEPDSADVSETIAAAMDTTVSRRDLLPDIEEINSTLRTNSDRSPATDVGQTAQLEVREKRSSRRGFAVAVMIIALLLLVYTFATDIGGAVPQAQAPLDSYVNSVDAGRDWLDVKVVQVLAWLDQTAQSSSQ